MKSLRQRAFKTCRNRLNRFSLILLNFSIVYNLLYKGNKGNNLFHFCPLPQKRLCGSSGSCMTLRLSTNNTDSIINARLCVLMGRLHSATSRPILRHTALNQPDDSLWVCVGHSPHCVRGTLRCWGDWLKDLSWACRLSLAYSWDLSACFLSCAQWGLKFCVAAQRPGPRPLSSLLRPAWRAGLVPPRDRRLDGWSRVDPDETKPGGCE